MGDESAHAEVEGFGLGFIFSDGHEVVVAIIHQEVFQLLTRDQELGPKVPKCAYHVTTC